MTHVRHAWIWIVGLAVVVSVVAWLVLAWRAPRAVAERLLGASLPRSANNIGSYRWWPNPDINFKCAVVQFSAPPDDIVAFKKELGLSDANPDVHMGVVFPPAFWSELRNHGWWVTEEGRAKNVWHGKWPNSVDGQLWLESEDGIARAYLYDQGVPPGTRGGPGPF